MKIELHDKGMDRNITLHFFPYETTKDERNKCIPHNGRRIIKELLSVINKDIVNCFLQGDTKEWMMIEFWSSDMDKIVEAVELVEERFGTKVK